MRRRKHKYLIIILILLFISAGFAYLTSTLDIVGIGHLKKASWNIYFDNVNIVEGNNLTSNPPTTSNHNTTSVSYTVNLTKPGDTYKFYIDIVNNGTIDAMVSLIDENTILTSDQSKYASYSISYIDGTPIQENNFLGRHSKETLQVIIKYKKDVTSSDLPTQEMNLSFNLRLTYKQAKNADSRTGESTIITDLSGNGNDGIMYGGRVNADGTVYLDGVDDYIDCELANYDFGDTISLVTKIKINSFRQYAADIAILENFDENTGNGMGLYLRQNKISFTIRQDNYKTTRYESNIIPVINTWYTIVGTYDGEKMKLYLNGEEISLLNSEVTYEVSLSGNIDSSRNFIIGVYPPSMSLGNGYSNLTISDVVVLDRALTSEEISTDYASTINPTNTSQMLLRYKLSSNTVKDLSGNNNNGTIHGAIINSDGTLTTDGIDDYINCGLNNYDFNNDMSFIIRTKINSIQPDINNAIIGSFQTGLGGIFYNSGSVTFSLYVDSQYYKYDTNYIPQIGKWLVIVGTYDGEKLKMYVNGKELSVRDNPNAYDIEASGNIRVQNYPIYIGAKPNTNGIPSIYAALDISDALIFDRAVTKEEVENDYAKTVSPSNREDLLLYYHFG